MNKSCVRHCVLCMLMLMLTLPSYAVLKEKNLSKTIGILKMELEETYKEQKYMMQRYDRVRIQQHEKLVDYMQQSEQISLMLYSQKSDFTFDIAYACSSASSLYKQLNRNMMPYDNIRTRIKNEVARYDSLIISLKELPPSIKDNPRQTSAEEELMEAMPDSIILDTATTSEKDEPFLLSDSEQEDREQCLIYAKALRNNLMRILNSIETDNEYYGLVSKKVLNLNNYAKQRYNEMQNSIFKDGTNNYITVLRQLPQQIAQVKKDLKSKYRPFNSKARKDRSEWRGPIVLAVSVFMIIYIMIATFLSIIILKVIPKLSKKLFPKFTAKVKKRMLHDSIDVSDKVLKRQRNVYALAIGVAIFALAIMAVKQFLSLNLFIMAAELMTDFAWLVEAILISLLIRLKPQETRHGVWIYMPFLWMALIVIFFRIVLIPNNLVNLICPPLLLAFTIWQGLSIRKHKDHLPLADLLYSSISLIVMVVSTFSSWDGYTLMAVQIIIWWSFQLAAIQTITCCYDLIEMYEERFLTKKIVVGAKEWAEKKRLAGIRGTADMTNAMNKGKFIQRTWLYDLTIKTIIPIAAILSILMSVYWAASIFEMTDKFMDVVHYKFIEKEGLIELSIMNICMVAIAYFIFRYINYITSAFFRLYRKRQKREKGDDASDYNETLARNVIAIIVWGIYILFSLVTFRVPRSGLEIVGAGLATGMGFATKDLLENFFYGISLMTGRLRVGDYIECDGIQGKVESITYQSTQIITLDGSVIAFLNASLFNKNFKNLTRNHSYELITIPVGIAYGSNVAQVRDMLTNAITPLCGQMVNGQQIVSPEKDLITIQLSNFGDNSIDLSIRLWPLVDQKAMFMAQVREVIYTTLNENNIEIPFPQRDVYIRSVANNSPITE